MIKSNARIGSFAFAQNTDDAMCHISFNVDGGAMNVQISMDQIADVISCFARILTADRRRVMVERDQFQETLSCVTETSVR